MKKSFLLCIFLFTIATSSLFAATRTWDNGGAPGDWEDPNNWSSNILPKVGDDVVIDGAYTVTLESTLTIESLRLRNGANLTIATTYTLTVFDNGSDGVKIEKTGGTLTINGTLNSYDHGGYGVRIDSLGTSVTLNGTLNSHINNEDGLKLEGPGAMFTVNGTLNSYDNSKDGITVEVGNSLVIPSSGKIYCNNNGSDGITLDEGVTNNGLISITNSVKKGIDTGGNINKYFVNNGTVTISGGLIGIDGKGTNWFFTNNGTMTLSESDTLVDDGTNIDNFGTFKGDGLVENGNDYDVDFKPGSTVAPGTSVGKFTFSDILNFTGVNLNMEIHGSANYDQILVQAGMHGPANVTLTGAILNLSGTYTPLAGDEFMILEKVSAGPITGFFSGLPNNTTFTYKGVEITISYSGGNGNDVVLTSLGPLPVELIEFSARTMEKEVKLAWATATETNNDYFTIERSSDGRSFENLGILLGNGNSTTINEYEFMDKTPLNGLNYYRLKQTDFDGEFSYSEIETVEFREDNAVQIYPTVVADIINIELDAETNTELTIVVLDVTGRVFKSFTIPQKEYRKEISLIDLLPGNYFISLYNDGIVTTRKFIKL